MVTRFPWLQYTASPLVHYVSLASCHLHYEVSSCTRIQGHLLTNMGFLTSKRYTSAQTQNPWQQEPLRLPDAFARLAPHAIRISFTPSTFPELILSMPTLPNPRGSSRTDRSPCPRPTPPSPLPSLLSFPLLVQRLLRQQLRLQRRQPLHLLHLMGRMQAWRCLRRSTNT